MDQRVSFVTLAVNDLEASRRFYLDGLGWTAALDVPGEVLMVKVADRVVLSLWPEAEFEAEVGPVCRGEGRPPVALAHNCATTAAVDAVLEDAGRAGASAVVPAVLREWGGYSGYFTDPGGFAWEIAYNPGPIGQEVLP
jgi:predicted lactoylglutathione lyase